MLISDEVIAIGCKKYRKLYPKGTTSAAIEEHAVLGATPNGLSVSSMSAIGLKGSPNHSVCFELS